MLLRISARRFVLPVTIGLPLSGRREAGTARFPAIEPHQPRPRHRPAPRHGDKWDKRPRATRTVVPDALRRSPVSPGSGHYHAERGTSAYCALSSTVTRQLIGADWLSMAATEQYFSWDRRTASSRRARLSASPAPRNTYSTSMLVK